MTKLTVRRPSRWLRHQGRGRPTHIGDGVLGHQHPAASTTDCSAATSRNGCRSNVVAGADRAAAPGRRSSTTAIPPRRLPPAPPPRRAAGHTSAPVPGCDPHRVARTRNVVLMRLHAGDHRAPAHPEPAGPPGRQHGTGRTYRTSVQKTAPPQAIPSTRCREVALSCNDPGVDHRPARRLPAHRCCARQTHPRRRMAGIRVRHRGLLPATPAARRDPRRGAGPRSVPSTASTPASGRRWPDDHLT